MPACSVARKESCVCEKGNQASPLTGPKGAIVLGELDGKLIFPNSFSYFTIFSCKAPSRRFACSGFMMTLLLTVGFGTPGNKEAKSIINSELECVIIAKLEYIPPAKSCGISIWN